MIVLLLGRSILNLHTSRFHLRSVVVVVLFIEQLWTFLAGWVFMHKGFAFRRRFGVSSYAVLIRVYVQICDSFVLSIRNGWEFLNRLSSRCVISNPWNISISSLSGNVNFLGPTCMDLVDICEGQYQLEICCGGGAVY